MFNRFITSKFSIMSRHNGPTCDRIKIPLLLAKIVGTGALIGGVITGVKDTQWCLDDYHLSMSDRDNILLPITNVSLIFIGNFLNGSAQGAVITIALPFLGPMYLHKRYRENSANNRSDVKQLFDRFTP